MEQVEVLNRITGLPLDTIKKALDTRIPPRKAKDKEGIGFLDIEDWLFRLGVKSKQTLWGLLSQGYAERREVDAFKAHVLGVAVPLAINVCDCMDDPSSFDLGRFAALLNLEESCPLLFNDILSHDSFEPYKQYLTKGNGR